MKKQKQTKTKIPCSIIHILQVIFRNTAIIASFTNSKKNFKLINDNMEKDMQKLKFVIMNKIHHCAIELNSATVEICTTDKKIDQNAPWCNEKFMF